MGHSIKNHYFSIDWLSFTFTFKSAKAAGIDVENYEGKPFDLFLETFPEFNKVLEECVLLAHGKYGYSNVLAFTDEFLLMYEDERTELGVFVTFPAHGLYRLGEIFDLPKLTEDFYQCQKLFQILTVRGAKCTRIDFCYDDFNKRITPSDFNLLNVNGQLKSRARRASWIGGANGAGDTFYLGTRGKNKFLRIYDKEVESKGKIRSIRYEMECKNEYAQDLAFNIASGIKFTFLTILDSFVEITEKIENINKKDINEMNKNVNSRALLSYLRSKVGVFEAWQQLREDIVNSSQNAECTEVIITTKRSSPSFASKLDWFTTMAKSLVIIKSCIGSSFDEILELARSRLEAKDVQYIENISKNILVTDDLRKIEF